MVLHLFHVLDQLTRELCLRTNYIKLINLTSQLYNVREVI